MRWSDKDGREQWDIVFKGIQATGLFVGVLWAAYTYWDTRNRELSKPFEEKKLAYYTEAARVLAHLSNPDNTDKTTEARFWELYFGELPFVQSTGLGSVAEAMNKFCMVRFGQQRCSLSPDDKNRPPGSQEDLAIKMSQTASKEIRARW